MSRGDAERIEDIREACRKLSEIASAGRDTFDESYVAVPAPRPGSMRPSRSRGCRQVAADHGVSRSWVTRLVVPVSCAIRFLRPEPTHRLPDIDILI